MATDDDDSAVVARLAEQSRRGDLDDRCQAVDALAVHGDLGTRALGEILEDSNTVVAIRAARALARIGSAASNDVLDHAIASPVEWARLAAAVGLASISDPRAVGMLRQALESADADQHPHAIEGLALVGTPDAVATLRGLAMSADEPPVIREQATVALGRLHDQGTRELLESLRSSSQRRVRNAARRALDK